LTEETALAWGIQGNRRKLETEGFASATSSTDICRFEKFNIRIIPIPNVPQHMPGTFQSIVLIKIILWGWHWPFLEPITMRIGSSLGWESTRKRTHTGVTICFSGMKSFLLPLWIRIILVRSWRGG
jgi:hypothetical protein